MVLIDITEEKKIEQRIKKSEGSSAPWQITWRTMLVDGEDPFIGSNKEMVSIYWDSLDEVKGWGWQKGHHPDHVEQWLNFSKHMAYQ
jgi:hypothetical protein